MWHEARRSERKVHDMMDAARKRAQRRAVFLAKRRGDPHQSIQAVGFRCRVYRDDGLYQATQEQQGLIPWNGKEDVLIDRFDGRALLDFIRESRHSRVKAKSEEEEEIEEFVNFERYRDLIKHRRRGFTESEALQHVNQEMDAKITSFLTNDRPKQAQPPASKGTYSQVGFSYDIDKSGENAYADDAEDESDDDDDDDDEDLDEDFNSENSDDEGMDAIAKEFGVKRYGWLVHMDKKMKEEEKRQKEVIKGDPAIKKLSRKERRKASQIEREREREAARVTGTRVFHHDPYREPRRSPTYEAYPHSRRSRSRSRSYSPSFSRRQSCREHDEDAPRSKVKTPKIEFITEFGGSGGSEGPKLEGLSPPSSPPSHGLGLNRPVSSNILEALHVDPAFNVSLDKEKGSKVVKPSPSTSSAIAKLTKTSTTGGPLKQPGEKKETPQERLKRIMSRQLNKQIKKDTAAEIAKRKELERQRLEKLAETSRVSRYRDRSRSRSYSRSPPRRHRRSGSRSRSRSSRRYYSRSPSRSYSPSRSPLHSSHRTRCRSRSFSRSLSRSPRRRSRPRY
ncbi:hypothetical protein MLD38_028889 [Melastoma candidum]|uniref:Uncharacterized protein n=1 Tax=Melastoma candidum TaxID=119954 RepID=A0ACB9N6K2_9MYRT|nr:hypothetical protein MLD38_028889 [Melastoma candidum]